MIGLNRHGGEIWRVALPAKVVTVACRPYGDVWAVLKNSRLLRMAKRENSPMSREVLVDVPTLSSVVGLIVLERALVVAASRGDIALHNLQRARNRSRFAQSEIVSRGYWRRKPAGPVPGIGPTILQPLRRCYKQVTQSTPVKVYCTQCANWKPPRTTANMVAIKKFVNSLDLGTLARCGGFAARHRTEAKDESSVGQELAKTLVSRVDSLPKPLCCSAGPNPYSWMVPTSVATHWRAPRRPAVFRASQRSCRCKKHCPLNRIGALSHHHRGRLSERRWSDNRAELVRQIDEGITLEKRPPNEKQTL